jgi:hypothetical protein
MCNAPYRPEGAFATLSMKFPKLLILIFIPLSIALFLNWFPYGAYFEPGSLIYILYASYFNDLVQPFGLYFVLCLFERKSIWVRTWWIKALIVFLVPSAMELLQGLGLNVLGRGFDPFDFLAYAAGGLLAALVEQLALARFGFWSPQTPNVAVRIDHPSKKQD